MLPSEFLQTRELCKGAYYCKAGEKVDETDDCDSCCIVGAIRATLGLHDCKEFEFYEALDHAIGTSAPLVWNDRPETTKDDVLAALRETEKRLGLK